MVLLSVLLVADPVVFSFAFFGCNRIEQDDWVKTRAQNPSSANVVQLQRNFADIAAMEPRPDMTLVLGDLVNNYAADDGAVLREQLDAWDKLVPSAAWPTVLPVPGNHELLSKTGKTRALNPTAEAVWNQWFAKHPLAGRIVPGPGNATTEDRISTEQSRLSYTLDAKNVRLIVLNTDTADRSSGIARVPIQWIREQVDKADRTSGIQHVFVVGHRNLVDPLTTVGDSPIDPALGSQLANILSSSRKVRGYLCAHVHAFDVRTFGRHDLFQVVAGNGGSQLEDNWRPVGGSTNGFSVIRVHRSGVVGLVVAKRSVPEDRERYLETSGPTTFEDERTIYRPSVLANLR